MQKTFILVALILTFVVCNAVSAEYYFIRPDVEIVTKTFSDNISRTEIWFAIMDSENFNHTPIESVVKSVTIRDQYNNSATYQYFDTPLYDVNENIIDKPEDIVRLTPFYFIEFRENDRNHNGTIEPDLGETEKRPTSDWQYNILTSTFPIFGGVYELTVLCNNGQTISTVISGIAPAVTLRPVTDINAKFDANGRFNISWKLPDEYLINYQDATIQIRVDRFERDGSKKFWRIRTQNLPLSINNQKFENYTYLKWASDFLRIYSNYFPYIKVYVRVDLGNNKSNSDWIGFKIDGYTVTPMTIPVPSYLTQEEVAAVCPGNSEYHGRPYSPGKSNPPGLNNK